jgi:hypothetical protein
VPHANAADFPPERFMPAANGVWCLEPPRKERALKPNYQYEKRQRELEKKKKKAEKEQRKATSEQPPAATDTGTPPQDK